MFGLNNGGEQARRDERKWFDDQSNEAAKLTNPIKRIFRLKGIGKIIDTKIKTKNAEKQSKLRSTNKLAHGALMMLSTYSFVAAMVINSASGGVLLPAVLAGAGLIGFIYGTDKIANLTQKRLESENRAFTDKLEDQKNILSRKAVRVMKDNIDEITVSPEFRKILKFSDLNQAFENIANSNTLIPRTNDKSGFFINKGRPGI